VAVALVVVAATRLVPLIAVQFYVQAVAVAVALWPMAYRLWTRPEVGDGPAGEPPTARAGR
jgi:hypothetical protein